MTRADPEDPVDARRTAGSAPAAGRPSLPDRVTRSLSAAGVVREPGLQVDEERTASRLELFFDLAFVLVVAERGGARGHDLSVRGVLAFGALFVVAWWSWASSALYANRFDNDDVVFRLFKLGGMFAVIGMAASAGDAVGPAGRAFATCYVVLRVLLFLQYVRAYRAVGEQVRRTLRLYLLGTAGGAALWSVSLLTAGTPRYLLWGAGLAVDMVVPLVATFAPGSVPLHLEHLPERLGLFVLLVLGESVAAVAHGVHDVHWSAGAVVVGAVSFLLAAGLWWTTFDLAGAAAKQLLVEHSGNGRRLAEDVFLYGHLPLTMGLAAVGCGIERVILEAGGGDASAWTRALLCGGVALYLASVSVTNAAMSGRWRTGWWWPTLAALVAVADALLTLPSLAVVGVLAALLVVVVVTGMVQESRGRIALQQL